MSLLDSKNNFSPLTTKKAIWYGLLGVLLYCIALFVRFESMPEIGLQSDERLWVGRSNEVLKKVRTDLRHVTSHLPHPGVTAVAVMATGLYQRERLNAAREASADCAAPGLCDVHILDAARTAITFVVALCIPVVFLGSIYLLGSGWAFLAALLLALDPRLIGYSRLAHIDGMLTLCVAITVLSYLRAVRRESLIWKLVAAVGWGLCLLTKPTGALVLPILVIFRLLRFIILKGNKRLLDWSDVWIVLIGNAVFVAFFTRLWDQKSHYISRLKVDSPLAREVLRAGRQVQEMDTMLLFAALGLICTITALFFCWRQVGSRVCYHAAQTLSVFAAVGALFSLAPVILRNLILYWTWVSGLSGVKHEAFGKVFEYEDAAGYLMIVGGEIPEAIILLGIIGLLYSLFTAPRQKSELALMRVALAVGIFLWVAFLETSSKQALRYALPVVPFLYLLAVIGLKAISNRMPGRVFSFLFAGGLLAYQIVTFLHWQPYQHTYFNRLVGGLPGAQAKGRGYLFAGQIPAVEFLVDKALNARHPLYVTVGGDLKTLEGVLKKHWPDLPVKIQFGQYSPGAADYVIRFNSHKQNIPASYDSVLKNAIPAFFVPFQGARLVEVFALPPITLKSPIQLSLAEAHRLTGDLQKTDQAVSLKAEPGSNPAGYLFFNDGIRLVAGNYMLSANGFAGRALTNKNLFRLELGKLCTRVIRADQIDKDGAFTGKVVCTIDKDSRVIPRIYWYGIATVTVTSLRLERIE